MSRAISSFGRNSLSSDRINSSAQHNAANGPTWRACVTVFCVFCQKRHEKRERARVPRIWMRLLAAHAPEEVPRRSDAGRGKLHRSPRSCWDRSDHGLLLLAGQEEDAPRLVDHRERERDPRYGRAGGRVADGNGPPLTRNRSLPPRDHAGCGALLAGATSRRAMRHYGCWRSPRVASLPRPLPPPRDALTGGVNGYLRLMPAIVPGTWEASIPISVPEGRSS